MATDYIVRADLVRGEMSRSAAGSIPASALADMAEALDLIVTGHPAEVPGRPGYWLTGASRGRALVVMLDAGRRPDADTLLTVAVCPRSRDSAGLWATLHKDQRGLLTRGDQPPATPWLAERIEGSAALHMDAMRWTGSLAQAIAWAWMEYDR